MTPKDRADLEAGLEAGVDWIAVSFVQRAEDVADVKKVARDRALVLAKIEKPQAISRLDEIIEVADAFMVARGDLGVEMPLEKVPGLQKRINRMARRLGKPVIVATQMLESMISLPVPTRAEVSDVATARLRGRRRGHAFGRKRLRPLSGRSGGDDEQDRRRGRAAILSTGRSSMRSAPKPEATVADAIAAAARDVAETLDLKAIVAWTSSGSTAFRIARERPEPPVLALTPNRDTARRLALVWGVHAVVTEDAQDVDDMAARACVIAASEGFAVPGERIIIVAGVPFGSPGATNMVRIAYIEK